MSTLADTSPGTVNGLGTVIVLLLIIAAVGIMYAMVRSLRRLRGNVNRGEFVDPRDVADEPSPTPSATSPDGHHAPDGGAR